MRPAGATILLMALLAVLAACGGAAAGPKPTRTTRLPAEMDSEPAPVDTRGLAQRLVTRSARLREGDLVLVTGGAGDLTLLEDLALEARKLGAHPLVELRTERMARRVIDEVPARYDRVPNEMNRRLTEVLSAAITIGDGDSDTLFGGLPARRLVAHIEATRPVALLARGRGVRQVSLGNGLFPTEERAHGFGMTKPQLDQVFWRGVDVDYDALQAAGEQIRRLLAGATSLHLTHPNGTDLSLRVAGRPVFVNDGVISPEDERRGGPARRVGLPAGEVFLTPVPGTADGVVVAERFPWQGQMIEQLTLRFRNGRLTRMSASSDMATLAAFYDAAPAGKDELGAVDVGINPNITIPEGTSLTGRMPAGMVTIVVGANDWAGGDNHAVSGVNPSLPGTTLTVDGVALVRNGRLQVPPPPPSGVARGAPAASSTTDR